MYAHYHNINIFFLKNALTHINYNGFERSVEKQIVRTINDGTRPFLKCPNMMDFFKVIKGRQEWSE